MKYAPTMVVFFALFALRDLLRLPFWALVAISLVVGGAIGALVDRGKAAALDSFELKVRRVQTGNATASDVGTLNAEVAMQLHKYRNAVAASDYDEIAESMSRLRLVGFQDGRAVELAAADSEGLVAMAESLVRSLRNQ